MKEIFAKVSFSNSAESALKNQWENIELLKSHQPKKYTGKLYLFKAQELMAEFIDVNDTYNHWQKYVDLSDINIMLCPGDHQSILFTDNAIRLSEVFNMGIKNEDFADLDVI